MAASRSGYCQTAAQAKANGASDADNLETA